MFYTLIESDLSVLSPETFLKYHKQSCLRIQKKTPLEWIIPTALTALIIDPKRWQVLADDSARLFALLKTISESLIEKSELEFLQGISLVEKALVLKNPRISNMVTARFDGIFTQENWQAVELNTTIPAMQGYTDAANALFLSNVSTANFTCIKLYETLCDDFLNTYPVESVLILTRSNDSQIPELEFLKKIFEKRGVRTHITTPEKISIVGQTFKVAGEIFGAVYRHIFASSFEPNAAFLYALQNNLPILNPVAVHYEVKSLFAIAHLLAHSPSLRSKLNMQNVSFECVSRYIPPTYILRKKISLLGEIIDQTPNLAFWKNSRSKYILKKNRSYGGTSVLLGSQFENDAWMSELERRLEDSQELWVIQETINAPFVQISSSDGTIVSENMAYFDFNIFMRCLKNQPKAVGPSARFSKNPVVNLGLGGGMLPSFIGLY